MDSKTLLLALITAMVTLAGAYLTFQGTVQTANPQQVDVLYDRIQILEDRAADDALTAAELRREINALELSIAASSSTSPRSVVDSFLSAVTDYPAWCKRYDSDRDVFVMWVINNAYSNFYDVSESLYLGNTDFFVWGRELGAVFDANDRLALERKDFARFVETVERADGVLADYQFWKFYVSLYDGAELVCGIQISMTEIL